MIETKCGEIINSDVSYGPSDWSSDWVEKSLEISLNRLQLDYVDLYVMHGGTIIECSDNFMYTFENMKT